MNTEQNRVWVCEVAEGPGSPLFHEVTRGKGDPAQTWDQVDVKPGLTVRFRYVHPLTMPTQEPRTVTSNVVNHPAHYNQSPSGVECIDVVEHMPFNLGNAVKYIWRHEHKNGIQDLEKAAWYLQREIERINKTGQG